MNVSIVVPDDLLERMESKWGNVPQRVLEALTCEAYRSGVITTAEVQRVLNLSGRWEVDQFLKQSGAYIDYTEEDLLRDIESIRKTRA